jgi:hypothetical protein
MFFYFGSSSKRREAPSPATLVFVTPDKCLKGISAGSAQHQCENVPGDGEVFVEVQRLVPIREVYFFVNRRLLARTRFW